MFVGDLNDWFSSEWSIRCASCDVSLGPSTISSMPKFLISQLIASLDSLRRAAKYERPDVFLVKSDCAPPGLLRTETNQVN